MGACATIVEGDDQTVSVITDPPGATCTLTCGGMTVGVANPTPASIVLEKSGDDVSVICRKDGHFDGASALSSSFQGMTFGNIVFGRIFGVAVDAASGAMHKYPVSVTIMLNPKSFSSAAALDEFVVRRKAQLEGDAMSAIAEVRRSCNPSDRDCDALVDTINAELGARLKELDTHRKAARVE